MSYLYFCNEDWSVSNDGTKVMCGDVVIADVYGSNNADYPEETQGANARLIAEAPLMYRMLESINIIYSADVSASLKDEIISKRLLEFKELRKRAECEVITRYLGNIRRLEEESERKTDESK